MKKIQIIDRIYGTFEIRDPFIIELISSQPMQRLKHIAQNGVPDEFYHRVNFYRFEHSVGVFLLLKHLGAPVQEQVAGLVHDVSHTAFSHVADYVFGDHAEQNFQDANHKKFIAQSGIAAILRRYSLDPDEIADLHRHRLLDQDMPALCADRIDYALREMPERFAYQAFLDLTTCEGMIIFKSRAVAREFARQFLRQNITHWASFEAATRYKILADALRRAIDLKKITKDDFWKTDAHVVRKLKAIEDPYIVKRLEILKNKSLSLFPKSSQKIFPKFRYVDPYFWDGSTACRLSSVDHSFADEVADAQKKHRLGIRTVAIS